MKKILVAILASAVCAGAAQATTTVTQNVNFGTHITEFDPSNPNDPYASQTFQLFDSDKGTLTGITVEVTYNQSSAIQLTNNTSGTISGYVDSQSTLYIPDVDLRPAAHT